MLQLFYKTSCISQEEWDISYKRIVSITNNFPLKLIRLEEFDDYVSNLNIDHFDLIENAGTQLECLSFYKDWLSFSAGATIRFYKDWEIYKHKELRGEEKDPNKPITWFPHYPFSNDGSLPKANGHSTYYNYIDTNNAAYQYAIIAIGIMLENLLPQKVFMITYDVPHENIADVITWLECHFQEPFELPIYFDKIRLLNSFRNEYTDNMHVVCRMEHLFRKQHKRNIDFAIKEIGYQPTFDFYSEILSKNVFNTFGFADVLDPWIAVTQDLENTLKLIEASKKLTIERQEIEKAEKYDLTIILKRLLQDFILWTPQQREELAVFYTNKHALETGDESLWGSIFRMTGNRVDICPMYANQEELFEAFMYHEPKKGKIFKTIIEEWVAKNENSFIELKEKLTAIEHHYEKKEYNEEKERKEFIKDLEKKNFISQYPTHEQPFIQLIVRYNPVILNIEKGVQNFNKKVLEVIDYPKNRNYIKLIFSLTQKQNIEFIKKRIKEDLECTVHPEFEKCLNNEKDKSVLFYLSIILTLKMKDRDTAYICYRILWDKEYWRIWEGVDFKIED